MQKSEFKGGIEVEKNLLCYTLAIIWESLRLWILRGASIERCNS